MPHPSSRRTRPAVERLESLDLLSAGATAADAKNYLTASTPSQGRQRGTINALVVVPATGYIAGVATVQYKVKVIPEYVLPFSPTVSFAMHITFTTPLDDPRPGDVTVTYSKNTVPFGGSIRARVAQGIVAFLRHDGPAIASAAGMA
jgi:hypothetical protein